MAVVSSEERAGSRCGQRGSGSCGWVAATERGKATAGGAATVAAAGREGGEAGAGRWRVVVPASAAVAGRT